MDASKLYKRFEPQIYYSPLDFKYLLKLDVSY